MKFNRIIIIIFLVALIFRLYSFWKVSVIQKDSSLYLYQAMVITADKKELISLCGIEKIKHISLFSLSIIPLFKVFKNWELAGKFVSFFSSLGTFFLLYFLLKKYLSGLTLYLTLLVYAVHPLIVRESAEIMRESLFTFFLIGGLFAYINGLSTYRFSSKFFWYALSSLLWILSSWIRVEGIILVPLTLFFMIFILLQKTNNSSLPKITTHDIFLFSIIPGILTIVLSVYIGKYETFLLNELKRKAFLVGIIKQPTYEILEKLKEIYTWSPTPYFWDMVKQNLWLIAIGTTVFYKFIPAIHFSNIIFLIIGLKNITQKNYKNLFFSYTFFLSCSYLLILTIFTYMKWYMEKRYMLPIIYFLAPSVGIGIENLKIYLQAIFEKKKIKFNINIITFVITFYILFFGIVEVLKPFRKDLHEIKAIAKTLSKKIPREEIKKCAESACKNLILTSDSRVLFYISSYTGFPLCPSSNKYTYLDLMKRNNEEIISIIKEQSFKVVLLERKFLKEKTESLKQKLDEIGIATYIIR